MCDRMKRLHLLYVMLVQAAFVAATSTVAAFGCHAIGWTKAFLATTSLFATASLLCGFSTVYLLTCLPDTSVSKLPRDHQIRCPDAVINTGAYCQGRALAFYSLIGAYAHLMAAIGSEMAFLTTWPLLYFIMFDILTVAIMLWAIIWIPAAGAAGIDRIELANAHATFVEMNSM